jgi:hypothetical protein
MELDEGMVLELGCEWVWMLALQLVQEMVLGQA